MESVASCQRAAVCGTLAPGSLSPMSSRAPRSGSSLGFVSLSRSGRALRHDYDADVPALRRTSGRRSYTGPDALFGGRRSGEGDAKKDEKKERKFITKEEEPETFWVAPDEKEGKNPMTTPLPYIAMLSVLSPFLILAIAFANNWIKLPAR